MEELIVQAESSREEWFYNQIIDRKSQLYRIAFSYLKNESDALEAIQAVTEKAFLNYKKLENAEYFNTWLFRVLINYCIDEIKRKRRFASFTHYENKTLTLNTYESDISKDNGMTGTEESIFIRSLLDRLNEKLRTIVILKYYEDLTFDQISKIIGKPESTVKSRLYKAQELLKKMIEKEGR